MQIPAKLRRVGQFPETAPVEAPIGPGHARSNGGKIHKSVASVRLTATSCQRSALKMFWRQAAAAAAYLWHVEQLVSCRTSAILYSLTRRSPSPGSFAGRS